jgi:hypothetical protein
MLKDLFTDAWRIVALLVVASVLFFASPFVAHLLAVPEVQTYGTLMSFLFGGFAVGHIARRLLFPSVPLSRTADDARKHPIGAGLVFLGVCIVLAAIVLASRPVQASELPARAQALLPVLKAQQVANWPGMPMPSVLAAQVEQETCASLSHRFCWNPRAEFKTSREYGFGLGQITVTGRFNVFQELKTQHRSLQGWSWESRYDANYQLLALVLKDRGHFQAIKGAATPADQVAFMLSAYNGGGGGVSQDRMTCRATPGCDAGRWFGHVEKTSYKAKLAVKGYGKSFFDINREYVRNVLVVRRPRYLRAMGEA